MQATKPLTPIKSKSKQDGGQLAGSNNGGGTSLAQRVMEVTTNREKLPQVPATTNTTPATKSAMKKPLVSTSGSDNTSTKSSINAEHETLVETLTSKQQQLEPTMAPTNTGTNSTASGASNCSSSSSSNVTTNSNANSSSSSSSASSSSNQEQKSLTLLLPTTANSAPDGSGSSLQEQLKHQHLHHHNHHHQHHHHQQLQQDKRVTASRQVLEVGSRLAELPKLPDLPGKTAAADVVPDGQELVVSLDTKVPHPSSEFSKRREEEVSYYNEAAAASITNLLEPKQAGGSLDNNTRPRLLAAVDAADRQSRQSQHQIQQQQQQQSQASLVTTLTSCQHLLRSNPYINDDQDVDGFESSTIQQLENQDEDDDLLRYDNAQVERNLRQNERRLLATTMCHQRHQQQQQQMQHQRQQQQQQQQHCQRQQVSISTSPKAKSAPATPCNVTPTAFHQTSGNLGSLMANPNCNTLPPDIRKNISATCRVLPSSLSVAKVSNADCQQQQQQQVSLKYLDGLSERGERALCEKDYPLAVELLSQCISLANQQQLLAYLKKNFKIYSHRAEAHLKLANYNEAIDDSMAARGLNPKWTQAYYLQGKAQFRIGQYADALAVFAFGLTHQSEIVGQAPPSSQTTSGASTPPSTTASNLFEALVEAASSYSPDGFKVKFAKLKALKLEAKPFLVVGLLGQELFEIGHCEHAAIVLESALKINNLEMAAAASSTTNDHSPPPSLNGTATNQQKKFKSSVLSTISAAYCKLHDYDKALGYMQRELELETELEDVAGQCRVLANLGYTHFKVRAFDKSLELHRKQLNLALRQHLFQQASQAFNALGHVHAARNNFTDALTSHERCLLILKQLGDNQFNQLRELLAIGHLQSQLADLKAAEGSYNEALQLLSKTNNSKQLTGAQRDDCTLASIMLNFNLAHLALRRQNYPEAEQHYNSVLKLSKSLGSSKNGANQTSLASKRQLYEMRASNGLGQTCRLLKRFDEAQCWFEEQLKLARTSECELGQSQALCNLGMIQQHFKNYQRAWRFFEDNLKLVEKNPNLKAYAHSYLGSNYFLLGRFNESRLHYETSLSLFRELTHCRAERKTIELNLALVQERLSGGTSNAVSNQQAPDVLLHPTTATGELRPVASAAKQTVHTKKVMMSAS